MFFSPSLFWVFLFIYPRLKIPPFESVSKFVFFGGAFISKCFDSRVFQHSEEHKTCDLFFALLFPLTSKPDKVERCTRSVLVFFFCLFLTVNISPFHVFSVFLSVVMLRYHRLNLVHFHFILYFV